MTREQFNAALIDLFQRAGDLKEIGVVLKPGNNDKMFLQFTITGGKVPVNYEGEMVVGRLQGNLFFHNVETQEFAETNAKAPKAQAATLSLADLKAKLAARK